MNITAPGKINKAHISFHTSGGGGDINRPEKVYRMTQPWDEDTVNWHSFGDYPGCKDDEYYNHNTIDSVAIVSNSGWVDFNLTEVVKFWVEYPDSNFGIIIKYDDSDPRVGVDQPKNSYNIFGTGISLGLIDLHTKAKHHDADVQWDKLAKLVIEYDAPVSVNSDNIANLKKENLFSWEREKLTIGNNSLCKNVKIYTINGVLVKSLMVSNNNRVLNYSNLAKGLYLFQFLTNNNRPLFNKKVLLY